MFWEKGVLLQLCLFKLIFLGQKVNVESISNELASLKLPEVVKSELVFN